MSNEMIEKAVKETLKQIREKDRGDVSCPLDLLDDKELARHKEDHQDWRSLTESLETAKNRGKWVGLALLAWILKDLYDVIVGVGKALYHFIITLPKAG